MRGSDSVASAASSGAGHLLSFTGTDTIPAILYLEKYYGANIEEELVGTSIPATEHSVMCAHGLDEMETYHKIVTEMYPDGFVSVVSDTWNLWNVTCNILPQLKAAIMNRDGRVVIRPDCYDEQTQILTQGGWKYFKDLCEDDLVAQVLDDETYEFVKPIKHVSQQYEGDMYHFTDFHGKLDMLVTPNHRMVFSKNGKLHVEFAEDCVDGYWGKDMIRSAKAINYNRSLSPMERLKIAFQADGSYCTGMKSTIRFSFAKDRKVKRLKEILDDAGLKYTVYDLSYDRYEFNVKVDASLFQKDFSWVDTSDLCSNWCAEFIEELSYWDATRRHDQRFKFDTTNKDVIDIVELIAMSAGYGILISKHVDSREDYFSDVYTAHILLNNHIGGQSHVKERVKYSGHVYCVQVPSGRIIVKRNRCTLVCGNSGDPVKILTGTIIPEDYSKQDTLDEACEWAEETAIDRVRDETAHGECGPDTVSEIFFYKGSHYEAKIDLEWNRYDKQFYVIEGSSIRECNMVELTPEQRGVVEILWDTFGGTFNEKGFKMLDSHIGCIYGDAITVDRCREICKRLAEKGFASTNVVFGIGSYTYHYNTRDTFGFALKSTYTVRNGEEVQLFKDPITDSGVKKSQRGRVVVHRDDEGIKYTDELDLDAQRKLGSTNMLQPIFLNGLFVNEMQSLSMIRHRVLGPEMEI